MIINQTGLSGNRVPLCFITFYHIHLFPQSNPWVYFHPFPDIQHFVPQHGSTTNQGWTLPGIEKKHNEPRAFQPLGRRRRVRQVMRLSLEQLLKFLGM